MSVRQRKTIISSLQYPLLNFSCIRVIRTSIGVVFSKNITYESIKKYDAYVYITYIIDFQYFLMRYFTRINPLNIYDF